jgi:hypothetical protein
MIIRAFIYKVVPLYLKCLSGEKKKSSPLKCIPKLGFNEGKELKEKNRQEKKREIAKGKEPSKHTTNQGRRNRGAGEGGDHPPPPLPLEGPPNFGRLVKPISTGGG